MLAAADATPSVLADVRALVDAYEAIVKEYPSSGYSDNALWQAGVLSIDGFVKFHQSTDKATGVRLLRKLAAIYVTSSLVQHVPEQLARVDEAVAVASEDTKTGPLATIKDIRRNVLADAVRVTIALDAE